MRVFAAPDPKSPTLVLAHGAGAGEGHPWMTRAAKALAERGVHVVTFNFPYMEAGRSAPDRGPVLEAAYIDLWKVATASAKGPVFAGGKSMGGRIASQAAARGGFDPAPVGLIFFGYPLHPPGAPQQRRDRHLPDITAPMLFLHGTRDGFGSADEMRDLAATLPAATLELIDGGDHSLVATKRADPSGQSLERVFDLAASWIKDQSSTRQVS
jgi:uncharacterized protein